MKALQKYFAQEDAVQKTVLTVFFTLLVVGNTIFILEEQFILPIAGIFGSIVLYLSVRYPLIAAIVVLFGRIFIDLNMEKEQQGLSIGSLFSVLCVVLALWHMRTDIAKIRKHVLFVPLCILASLILIAAFRATDLNTALTISLKILLPFILFYAFCAQIHSHRAVFYTLCIIAAASLMTISTTFYHWYNNQMATYLLDGYGRLVGSYTSHRIHALSLFLFIFVYISLGFRKTLGKWRYCFFGLAGLSLFFLYHTHTRSAQLITILGIFSLIFTLRRWLYLTVFGVIFSIVVLTTETIQDRFKDLLLVFDIENVASSQLMDIGSGRYLMWSRALPTYFEQTPFDILFGLGLGKHTLLSQRVYDPFSDISSDSQIQYSIDTHNNILFLLFQFGPLSLLIYTIILWHTLKVGLWLIQNGKTDWERTFGAIIVSLVVGFAVNDSLSNGFVERASLNTLLWPIWAAAYKLQAILISEQNALPKSMHLDKK